MPPFRNMVSKPRKCVVDLPHSGTYGFETSLNVSMAYTLQGAWFRNQGNVSATCHVQEYGFETSENVSAACPPPCAWFRNLRKRVDGMLPSRRMVSKPRKCVADLLPFRRMVSKPRKRVGYMPRSGIWF